VKEVRYFVDSDFPARLSRSTSRDFNLDEYSQYFQDFDATHHRIAMEATPDYMYQQAALERLPQLPTRPRFLFFLRRPENRVYSLYRFAKLGLEGLDADTTFAQFVDELRSGARRFENNSILKYAIRHGEYVTYLDRWLASLSPERMFVALMEDVSSNPRSVMKNVCRFLELDDACYEDYDFPVLNQTYAVRHQGFHRWRLRMEESFPFLYSISPVRSLYRWLNVRNEGRKESRSSADEAAYQWLREHYRPFNAELSERYGLNLSSWM
jgi:hypothetical protein